MKRWEMLARALETDKETARYLCDARRIDPDAEMAAPDLGRDIAAALLIVAFHTNYGPQLDEWERVTGRKKEDR